MPTDNFRRNGGSEKRNNPLKETPPPPPRSGRLSGGEVTQPVIPPTDRCAQPQFSPLLSLSACQSDRRGGGSRKLSSRAASMRMATGQAVFCSVLRRPRCLFRSGCIRLALSALLITPLTCDNLSRIFHTFSGIWEPSSLDLALMPLPAA